MKRDHEIQVRAGAGPVRIRHRDLELAQQDVLSYIRFKMDPEGSTLDKLANF